MLVVMMLWAVAPACPSEDSGNYCKWDSHKGQSFAVVAESVVYVDQSFFTFFTFHPLQGF